MLLLLLLFCCLGYSASSENVTIKHVHLIYMNHLDVGYSCNGEPGFLLNVLNRYFTDYFPRAVKIGLTLLVLGYRERFIYTTHPWLVSLYLDCPPNFQFAGHQLQCPDFANKTNFIDAIKRGFITWHAGPMNMEFEMMDELMNEFGIKISLDLDKRFGKDRKYRTVSQRDVPGTTISMIPIFKKMGISALSIGVNQATTPAAVPNVFMWKNGNESILTFYHPDGYPEPYGSTPSAPGGMSKHDCHTIPGFDRALCFAFRTDNRGPPLDFKEVLLTYDIARAQFPEAMVNASTFDEYVGLAMDYVDNLPVVTQEMGDVWIQGAASDPLKVAQLRALYRVRRKCFKDGRCTLDDPRIYNSSRFMLKLSEHTWGSDGGFLDVIHWTNDQFYKILGQPNNEFYNATIYWDEQRYMTQLAIEALGNHSLVQDIYTEFNNIKAQLPNIDGMKKLEKTKSHQCGNFMLQFNTEGSLIQLKDAIGRNWASVKNPVGKLVYRTYNQKDFEEFFNATTPYSKHFFLGIGKPNMSENAAPESKCWSTSMDDLFTNSDSNKLVVMLSMNDEITRSYYGAPEKITLEYSCSDSGIDVILQWFNKVPTRLPEGIDFIFTPIQQPGYKWYMNKIEDLLDPLDVVINGSQRLHALNRGMYYMDDTLRGVEITSLDTGLVNILTDKYYVSTIPEPVPPFNSMTGIAFNLYNNVWETNYIFWYPYKSEDANRKYRFNLNFK
ncbi:hypothetical protein ACF0H5_007120 [Mactra antiquata]